jgi:hypothetical protein
LGETVIVPVREFNTLQILDQNPLDPRVIARKVWRHMKAASRFTASTEEDCSIREGDI